MLQLSKTFLPLTRYKVSMNSAPNIRNTRVYFKDGSKSEISVGSAVYSNHDFETLLYSLPTPLSLLPIFHPTILGRINASTSSEHSNMHRIPICPACL